MTEATPVPSPADPPSPAGAYPLYGPRFQTNPADVYREMRKQHGPVAPVLLDGGIPAWLVLGYREVHYVTDNSSLYARDPRRWNQWHRIPPDWGLLTLLGYQPSVMCAEGTEHQRRSEALNDALAAVDQFEIRSYCEQVADEKIDGFAETGEADLIADYADQVPLPVLAKIVGLGGTEIRDVVRDMNLSVVAGEEAIEAYERNRGRMTRLVELRRTMPASDVTSRLIAAPMGLTDKEVIEDILLVMGAGQLPTANWIGNTLRLMLTDDRFALTLSGGRRSVAQAMNEVLWADTPTQNMAGRFATRDTQLAGHHIRAGDLLILGLAAANNDPQVRPDSYTDSGGNQAHMSFSHGEHRCPFAAQEIAELIAETAIEILLDRLPDVALAANEEALVWQATPWMRSLTALPVQFTPAYVSGSARSTT